MAEKMTLEQVRDRMRIAQYGGGLVVTPREAKDLANVIDANIAQPAQTVDVGAIREVIKELKAGARDSCYRTQQAAEREWCDKLTRAIGNKGNGVA